ncbi:MAG: hypothetical protein MUF34_29300 [Polyangiaceae bacterium]|nr:hypothetical protein [Polyangiaceae bacterium]
MTNRRSKPALAAALLFAFSHLGADCDGDVIEDSTFRAWCGDQLCAWTTETGSVGRAPTWHRNDYGVALLTTPTVISQIIDGAPRCLSFTTVADVEPSAQVTLGIDFDRDGSVDVEQPIGATGFRQVRTELTAPLTYDGIRFIVSKQGAGRAVLAELRAQSSDQCTAPPIELKAKALGARCQLGGTGECASGVCCGGTCSECCDPAAFGDWGRESSADYPPLACPSGARCAQRAEAVARDDDGPNQLLGPIPLQCEPGQRQQPAGGGCLADDDCAGGVCEGASSEASLQGWGAGLPFGLTTVEGQREDEKACAAQFPNKGAEGCEFIRVRGGHCR